jgi:hypothetical protein
MGCLSACVDGRNLDGFSAYRAHYSSASSRYFSQIGQVTFEYIGLITVDQGELRSTAHTDAHAIGGRFAQGGGMLGSALGAGDHALIRLLRLGLGRLPRSNPRYRGSGSSSQSCDQKRKRAGDGTAEYHDLNPNAVNLHASLASFPRTLQSRSIPGTPLMRAQPEELLLEGVATGLPAEGLSR